MKRLLVTTCICVVIFTVFVQGCTIKKMVEILGVTRASKKETTMSETVNDRVLGYTVAGIEELLGESPINRMIRHHVIGWSEGDETCGALVY